MQIYYSSSMITLHRYSNGANVRRQGHYNLYRSFAKRFVAANDEGTSIVLQRAGNYHLGTMNDYPVVDCILHKSHLGYSPYGAYGIGENIGASLSAITSSAIYNALGK